MMVWFDVVLRRCWRVSSTTEATASTSRQRHHGQTQPQTGLTRLQQERKRKVARKAAAKRRPRRLARGSAPSFQVRLHFQRNPSCIFDFRLTNWSWCLAASPWRASASDKSTAEQQARQQRELATAAKGGKGEWV